MGRELNLGKVMITAEGDWIEGRSYEFLSAVHHKGSGYIAVSDNSGVEPGTDNTVWMLFAEGGKVPELTIDDEGNLYTDGELLTSALKDLLLKGKQMERSEAAREAAESKSVAIADADVLTRGASAIGATIIGNNSYIWGSCRYSASVAWNFYGSSGLVRSYGFCNLRLAVPSVLLKVKGAKATFSN